MLAVVLLFAALTVVAIRARMLSVVPLAGLLVLLLGAETYLRNIVQKATRVWPVRIELGPLHLPGEFSIAELLAAGPLRHAPTATWSSG